VPQISASEFPEVDADKTRMIGLPYGEKNYANTLSRFHTISEGNGRTVRRTGLLYQYRASDKLIGDFC